MYFGWGRGKICTQFLQESLTCRRKTYKFYSRESCINYCENERWIKLAPWFGAGNFEPSVLCVAGKWKTKAIIPAGKGFLSQWWGRRSSTGEVMWEITHRCAACGFWRIKAIPLGSQQSEECSGGYSKALLHACGAPYWHFYYTNRQILLLRHSSFETSAISFFKLAVFLNNIILILSITQRTGGSSLTGNSCVI